MDHAMIDSNLTSANIHKLNQEFINRGHYYQIKTSNSWYKTLSLVLTPKQSDQPIQDLCPKSIECMAKVKNKMYQGQK